MYSICVHVHEQSYYIVHYIRRKEEGKEGRKRCVHVRVDTHVHVYLLEVTRERHVQEDLLWHTCMYMYMYICLIYSTNHNLGARYIKICGTRPLNIQHLYDNLAVARKLSTNYMYMYITAAERRQACMSPARAYTCTRLSGLCNCNACCTCIYICCSAQTGQALMLSCLGTAIDLLDIYRQMACMNWVT